MLNFQDLPDELVLEILRYSEIKDLISCGQVSKRIRRISHDSMLWMTVNFEKKIVKTELLEMVLRKGCQILNLCNTTILGNLSSNIKSQLRVLKLSRPGFCMHGDSVCDCDALEELLFSCCSLQHLVISAGILTPKMVETICKNGKTLQILNLNCSDLGNYLQEIIQCCQELKEVDLAYVNYGGGITHDDLGFLAEDITPNVEKLNLSSSLIIGYHVKTLLGRCNKIKALRLEATFITDHSLMSIRKCSNCTLEELSLGPCDNISFTGLLLLKSMPRLKILNLYYEKDDDEEIQNLRQQLPHAMIKVSYEQRE